MRHIIFAFLFTYIFCPKAFALEDSTEIWTCSYAYKSESNNQFSPFTRNTGVSAGDTLIERFIKKDATLEMHSDDEVSYLATSYNIVLDNEYALIATHPIADARHASELATGGITAVNVVIDKQNKRFTIAIVRADHLVESEERRGTCMKNS